MRKIIVYLIAFCIQSCLYAQDITVCENIVKITRDAINNKSTEELEKHLSTDFSCSGQKGEIAKLVLKQLVTQLNDHVSQIEKISEEIKYGTLTLIYEFTCSNKLEKRNSTFIFNDKSELKQLDLFSIQVKTLTENISRNLKIPNEEYIIIPIKRNGNLFTVKAKVNGIEGEFIFDSGSPRLILNKKYFGNNDTEKESVSNVKDVNGHISNMDIINIKEFDFYGIKAYDTDLLVLDLSHLEIESPINGILGYEVFKDYDLIFDYENNTLTLIKPEVTSLYIEKFDSSKIEVPIEMTSHIAYVNGEINGIKIKLGIDTGAGVNMLWNDFFYKISENINDVKETNLKGAGKDTKQTSSGYVDKLIIGSKIFNNTYTIFNDMLHTNLNEQIDGLIGYEILSKQKTLLSYINKKMIFID